MSARLHPLRWLVLATALAATPSLAADPKPDPTEEPEIPELTDEQRAELFADYDDAMKTGQKTRAADALLPILDDPEAARVHGDAWVKLGDLLVSFDMEYSALLAYTSAIAVDPAVGASKVGAAMDLAEKLGDTGAIAPTLAKNVGLAVDKGTRSRIAYLAAQHNVRTGAFGTASALLRMVDSKSDDFVESEALRGVVLAQLGQHNDALAPFLTSQQLAKQKAKGERFNDVLNLNIARTYFAAENYPRAIQYYALVGRGSEFWPQAMFERAWAHFRVEDMNGTLALLMIHGSPFLADWYFPEADLLKVYALFLMCKFPDASREVDAFEARYRPLLDTLNGVLPDMTPQMAWDEGVARVQQAPTRIPGAILRRFDKEDVFNDAIATVARADEELSRLANASSNPFAQRAADWLRGRRAGIVREQGQRVLDHAEMARSEVKGFLANTKVTKLDIMQYEARLYDAASVTGEVDFGDRIGALRKLRKSKKVRTWPYQGESWADELGYYKIDARADCSEKL